MKNYVADLMASSPSDWDTILERDYAIKIVRDGRLASLKYNQIESPMHMPIVQQCRGMVVDTERRQVMAWPYDKFWNHGEALAAPIDWSTARVQEKLDGSLMILWCDDLTGAWHVSSSGHPTAGGSFGDDERTFATAFWETWHSLGMKMPGEGYEGWTFMFEYCDSPNRVVVRHERPRIVLHGARDAWDREAVLSEQPNQFGWEVVRSFPIHSIADCLSAADALDPIQQEGFVVVDAAFNRVKIKSPRYVVLHHMKGEATPRRAIELWQTGETGELLAHFPEMAAAIIPVHDQLDSIAAQAVSSYVENLPRPTRKEFAMAVKDLPWSAVCFKLIGNPLPTVDDAKAIMRASSLASLERLVGV